MTAGHAFVWAGGTREAIAVHHLPVVDGVARRPGPGPWVLLLGRLHVHAPTLNERVVSHLLLQGLNATAVIPAPAVAEDEDIVLPPPRRAELNDPRELVSL